MCEQKNKLPQKGKLREYIYETKVRWINTRKGKLGFGDSKKPIIDIATPPEFQGHEGIIGPEDLFVASVNSCILTTFLAFTDKLRIKLLSYESHGKGFLNVNEKPYRFRKVIIEPTIIVEKKQDIEKVKKAMELAEKYCLITNSINASVEVVFDISVSNEVIQDKLKKE